VAPDASKIPSRPVDAGVPSIAKYGTVRIFADPALTVTIDGVPAGDTPVTKQLTVGRHKIRLSNSEYQYSENVPVTISEGKTVEIPKLNWKK